ncbi:MAG: metallophosphoesterase [Proteobacteria bacterium]|nr:metallophosphoesterase [Pseudomonadota bacterium]
MLKKRIASAFFLMLFLLPVHAFSLIGKSRTGGMSEVFVGESRVSVSGGFVEWYDDNTISVRAKALEVSITIDNLDSDKAGKFDFRVSNVNPELTKIIGLGDADIKKGNNSLDFSSDVEAKKVAVYKLFPDLKENEYKFMVFAEASGGGNVFDRIISDVNYRKPLFVVSGGDMLEHPGSSAYDDFLEKVGKVRLPFLSVPGSMETAKGGHDIYPDYFGAAYYSFEYKGAHFVFLDNGAGYLSEEQFLWLDRELMQSKAANKFVFMHLPPFDPRPGREAPMGKGGQFKRLSSILEKYKVNYVFSAGIHSYFKKEVAGVNYIISGGAGSELASTDSYYNYVIVDVKGDEVAHKVVKLDAPSLAWHKSACLKLKIYLKASFVSNPVRTVGVVALLLFIVLGIIRFIYMYLFSRKPSKRLSL